MHTGDNNQHDTEPDLIRVLPSDGVLPLSHTPDLDPKPARRWWPIGISALAAVLAVAVLASAPRPTDPTTAPPPLSAIPGDPVNLSTSLTNQLTDPWTTVAVPAGAQFNDMVHSDGLLVAVGQEDGLARAWFSTNGAAWNRANEFEPAGEDGSSALHRAVPWGGETVGIGRAGSRPAVWTAPRPAAWDYEGPTGFESDHNPDFVAGDQLLAVLPSEGRHDGWVSDDGLEWEALGELEGLTGVAVVSYAAHGGWYYAAGFTGPEQQPVIYRSAHGRSWSPTDGEAAGILADAGVVHDIAATDEGLIAIGWTESEQGPATIWTSPDGSSWALAAGANDGVFASATTDIELTNVDPVTGNATLSIDGAPQRVAAGSHIDTDGGTIVVASISKTGINATIDGVLRVIPVSDPGIITRHPLLTSIAADGRRIVIVGQLHSTTTFDPFGDANSVVPAVWVTADRGMTWEMSALDAPADSWASHAALIHEHIAVIGFSGDTGGPLAWRTAWNTDVPETMAVRVVEEFFTAISNGARTGAASFLDTTWTTASTFQLPGLGGIDLEWWTGDPRETDLNAVEDTLGYMIALRTRVAVENCRTRANSREVDRVQVTCDFTVTSDLLDALGPDPAQGTLQAQVENGIKSIAVSTTPSHGSWRSLAAWAATASPEEAATVVSFAGDGGWELAPIFAGDSASGHVALAQDLIAASLLPGQSRTVATTLGNMEWTWVDNPPAGVTNFSWATYLDGRYLAGSNPDQLGSSAMRLWQSTDGASWIPFPEPGSAIDAPLAFGDGLLAWGEQGIGNIVVWSYDGDTWTGIPATPTHNDSIVGPSVLAVAGDRALLAVSIWDESAQAPQTRAWRLDQDLTPQPVTLPAIATPETGFGLVGSPDGFTLTVGGGVAPGGGSVWRSRDGASWTQIAGRDTAPTSGFPWKLHFHAGNYFLTGSTDEEQCSVFADGGQFCLPVFRLWASPDGVIWQPIETAAGQAVPAVDMGSGPLGMAALGFVPDGPRAVYLSPPGGPWSMVEQLHIHDPAADAWWLRQPVVGADGVLLIGTSIFDDASFKAAERPIIIIGRVIES